LRGSDLAAEVRLAGLAEFAFLTFWCTVDLLSETFGNFGRERSLLESNNIISWLDGRDALSNGFYNASSLMPKDDWEGSLRILSRKCVCICENYQSIFKPFADVLKTYQCGKHQCNRFRF
jgi:hypothetical protein